MATFNKIKHFFLSDPIEIGAQQLDSNDVVLRMNRKAPLLTEDSPYAKIAGLILSERSRLAKIRQKPLVELRKIANNRINANTLRRRSTKKKAG